MNPNVPFPQPSSSRRLWLTGTAVLVVVIALVAICYAIISGETRQFGSGKTPSPSTDSQATSSTETTLVSRQLDGVMVTSTLATLRPWAFMVDNQVDARPGEGLSKASVVYESPVEGGITRFLAVFDPTTDPAVKIGPVRSARPYFVDWASSMNAVYGHVGGSPDALDKIARISSSTLLNADEMTRATAGYWRDSSRVAPHHVLTNPGRFAAYLGENASSTVRFSSWRYTASPAATSTTPDVSSIRITYGGSYNVRWAYDATKNQYRRTQAVKANTRDAVYASNVVVIKTDAKILDDKGRLGLRTTGGGEAVIYRDGKKFIGRWHRAANEMIGFSGLDGSYIELRAGATWIQVTTDDLSFAGLEGSK